MVIGNRIEFLKAQNFLLRGSGGQGRQSPCQISLKLVNPLLRYCDLSIFQIATATILDFGNHKILLA